MGEAIQHEKEKLFFKKIHRAFVIRKLMKYFEEFPSALEYNELDSRYFGNFA